MVTKMDQYSSVGSFWWIFTILGFVLSYGLRKTGVLATDKSQSAFATWGAALFAAAFALFADTGNAGTMSELFGRLAIFLLVWVVVGITFTIGISLGIEKADSSPSTVLQQTRKMAEQGDSSAQCNLGNLYADGQTVPQNYQEALKWFRLSAAQGYSEAQANLGALYHGGFGVPEDYVQAMMWFMIAKASGTSLADQNIQQLESVLTPTQIANARKMAQKWQETHHSPS